MQHSKSMCASVGTTKHVAVGICKLSLLTSTRVASVQQTPSGRQLNWLNMYEAELQHQEMMGCIDCLVVHLLQHQSLRRRGDPHIKVYALTNKDEVRVIILNENDLEDDTEIILPGKEHYPGLTGCSICHLPVNSPSC